MHCFASVMLGCLPNGEEAEVFRHFIQEGETMPVFSLAWF